MMNDGFHWLRRLRRVRGSLDDGSAAALVHAFVASRVDCCSTVCAGAPGAIADRLRRVLGAAARVVGDARGFGRGLASLLHDGLRWLDVPERVACRMGVVVCRCLRGQAPRCLADHLITSSDVASRLRLRFAGRHRLVVPRCRLAAYGRRAFSVAGPMVWSSLPDGLGDPACGSGGFGQFRKTILFSLY